MENLERVAVDTGILLVTDRHLYFKGSQTALRVPYAKLLSSERFSDGIGLIQNGARANWQFFLMDTSNGWFLNELVDQLNGAALKSRT